MQIQTQTQTKNKKFWNFVNNGDDVELRIDGDIVDSEDAWMYQYFGIPVATPNVFRDELAQYSGKNITVWIDSYGGSVFAGIGLYNALMEHKKSGAKVTTVTDGKCMSAATMPYMAGDERLMSTGGMLMVHNPLIGIQGYASDLRKCADYLDEVTQGIINIYEAGTGLTRDKIASIMDNETYMSADTAVKEGFSTGMVSSEPDNKKNQANNFMFNRLAIMNTATDAMKGFYDALSNDQALSDKILKNRPTFPAKPVVDINKNIPPKEEENKMEIKNVADLKVQLPAIYDEVCNSSIAAGKTDGVKAERDRLKAFDVLNGKVDPEFLAKEKYEDGATAESVLFKAMQEGKMINAAYVAQAEIDAIAANSVPGGASDNMKPDEVTGILNKVANVAKKALGIEGGNK